MGIISTGNSITFEYHAHDCKLKHAMTNHLNFHSSMQALLVIKVANSCEIFAVWVFIDRLTPAGSTGAHWQGGGGKGKDLARCPSNLVGG